MKKVYGFYGVAEEIFENLISPNTEAVVSREGGAGIYTVAYRNLGDLGDPEYERSIVCTVDLSSDVWHYNLAEWGVDSDLIGTSDLDNDLAREYIEGPLWDTLNERTADRWWELEQIERERAERERSERETEQVELEYGAYLLEKEGK